MNKIIFISSFIVFNLLHVYSQADYSTITYIYTCKNAQIEARLASIELTTVQKNAAKAELLDPTNSQFGFLGLTASDIIGDASYQYNCHAYAWHLTEGYSNKVWVRQTNVSGGSNLSKYWSSTEGCFVEVSEADAQKVFYYTGDHSAVKSTVAGKYESKWGQYSVVRHNPMQVPYSSPSNRRYYAKCVGGPITSFTISNYMSGTGLSTCPSEQVTIQPILPTGGGHILEGQWQSSGCTVNSSSNSSITITAPSAIYASFTLQYRYRDACGWSAWTPIYGSTRNCAAGEDPYRIGISNIYPNPVDNVLSISINTGALSQSTPMLRSASVPTYSIRLYNLQSALVRQTNVQGDNIELNVSDLPDGIYVIHVIDSKGVKIGEHKMVIKH